ELGSQTPFSSQKLLAEQSSPLDGFTQTPVFASQVPWIWHLFGIGQTTGAPETQTPLLQVSPLVQAAPSSQGAFSAFAGLEQVPFVVSQTPTSWHASTAA